MSGSDPIRRGASSVLIVLLLSGCYTHRPLPQGPVPATRDVRARLTTAADLVAERGAGDSVTLTDVREVRGRIARVEGDSLWLMTGTEVRSGVVAFREGQPFTFVRLQRGQAALSTRHTDPIRTTLVVAGAALLLLMIIAAATFDFDTWGSPTQ